MNEMDKALLAAARRGDVAAAAQALGGNGDGHWASANAIDVDGQSALCSAISMGSQALVQLLLAHGANPNQSRDGRKSAMVLAAQGSAEASPGILGMLIDAGGDAKQKFIFNGASLLAEAARAGQLRSMELLIAKGASVHEVDAWGQTAVHAAATWAGPAEIGALAKASAPVDYPYAAKEAPGPRIPSRTMSPLALASSRGRIENVTALLDAGADPNAVGHGGRTALFAAASSGSSAECERALLRAGASANHSDHSGATPLMAAAQAGKDAGVAELLLAGADPMAKSAEGWSAIMFAAKHGMESCVALLVKEPFPEEADARGESLAQLARAGGCSEKIIAMVARAVEMRFSERAPQGRPFAGMSSLALSRSRTMLATGDRNNQKTSSAGKSVARLPKLARGAKLLGNRFPA